MKRRVLIAVFAVSVGIAALMTEGVRAGDGAAPAAAVGFLFGFFPQRGDLCGSSAANLIDHSHRPWYKSA